MVTDKISGQEALNRQVAATAPPRRGRNPPEAREGKIAKKELQPPEEKKD
jgi:hypothetical protein